MTGKKSVRSRILFQKGYFALDHVDVTSTFNMTERQYLDRSPDMLIEDENGVRYRIVKSIIIAIREVEVVDQVVQEVPTEETGENTN